MKTFDDLQSYWEDLNIEPYTHDGKNEITLMTAGDDNLVINILNKDIDDGDSFHLYDVRIDFIDNNNFKIKFLYNEDLNCSVFLGEHPINGNENIMILDIPEFGKRYFEKKSGNDYQPKPLNLK